ncbi:4Fe-4S dicluster domain-containing protein [bacterium]|nr:4Fe-4S dicluster domain-containing protein [candidate division CSSED10-310 bacterium]
MSRRLRINPDPCTGCLNCMAACMQHLSGCADSQTTGIRVILNPFTGIQLFYHCRQCVDAACAAGCPVSAIRRDSAADPWRIDSSVCIQCGRCVKNCPYQAVQWSTIYGPVKCDLCDGDPECVKACHFGVLHFETPDAIIPMGIPEYDLDQNLGKT